MSLNATHPLGTHPLGIGLIGYGGFGRFLHRAWSELDGVRLVAVADERVDLPAGAEGYRGATSLLADPAVEIVSICTPPATHADLACAALEAGKHVLVEKPLATSLADADRVLEAQRRTGRRVGVNYVLRYTPLVEWVLEHSRRGTFGALRHATVENVAQDETLAPEHWFWDLEQSGGVLVEHAVHFIDLLHQCVAKQGAAHLDTNVRGAVQRRDDGRVDRWACEVCYGHAALVHQYHAFTRPRAFERTRIHLGFERLDLDLDGWIPLSGEVHAWVGEEGLQALETLPGWTCTAMSAEGSGPGGSTLHHITGTCAVSASKDAVYRRAVQGSLLDLVKTIRQPGATPRVTLEDARESLAIAIAATKDALGG